jgi:hypothetical protein
MLKAVHASAEHPGIQNPNEQRFYIGKAFHATDLTNLKGTLFARQGLHSISEMSIA